MKLKVFSLRYEPDFGGFDDGPMRQFIGDKTVLGVHEHFFHHDGTPVWAVMVSYREPPDPMGPRAAASREPAEQAAVATTDRATYETLRRWRNERAKREGRPPYVILNNRQAAELARRRPRTREELLRVPGIGDARAEAYGDELLSLVRCEGEADPMPEGPARAPENAP